MGKLLLAPGRLAVLRLIRLAGSEPQERRVGAGNDDGRDLASSKGQLFKGMDCTTLAYGLAKRTVFCSPRRKMNRTTKRKDLKTCQEQLSGRQRTLLCVCDRKAKGWLWTTGADVSHQQGMVGQVFLRVWQFRLPVVVFSCCWFSFGNLHLS